MGAGQRLITSRRMGAPRTPPGWYPDPSGAPGQRYFDGTHWTEFGTHSPHPTQPVGAKRNKKFVAIAAVAGVLTAIGVIVTVSAGGPPRDEASYQQGFTDAKEYLRPGVAPGAGFCEDRYEFRYRAGAKNVKKDYFQGCIDAGGQD